MSRPTLQPLSCSSCLGPRADFDPQGHRHPAAWLPDGLGWAGLGMAESTGRSQTHDSQSARPLSLIWVLAHLVIGLAHRGWDSAFSKCRNRLERSLYICQGTTQTI